MAKISIDLVPDYQYSLTPSIVGEAVQKALAFGTDDTLDTYEGVDALSQPLLDSEGTAFGFVNIR